VTPKISRIEVFKKKNLWPMVATEVPEETKRSNVLRMISPKGVKAIL